MPSNCPSWARTRTLLIQSQTCCQLHQGALSYELRTTVLLRFRCRILNSVTRRARRSRRRSNDRYEPTGTSPGFPKRPGSPACPTPGSPEKGPNYDLRDPFGARAGDRARTGDPQLGKLMLYQLSYARALELPTPARGVLAWNHPGRKSRHAQHGEN
jgi:hypothetical protein